MSEDVVLALITYNSASRLRGITLDDVLNSTLQIPYKSIILVDDSIDDTRKIVRKWTLLHGKELVISGSRLYGYRRHTRATARQTAIDILENFTEDFLMFIDDDVILKGGWWDWVEENNVLGNPKVGEVWGVDHDVTSTRRKFIKLVMGADVSDYLVGKFRQRGGTHDTIYRRGAIAGAKIPPELHVYEDAFLHHWVVCGGWESVINPVGVIHYRLVGALDKSSKELMSQAIRKALALGIREYDSRIAGLVRPLAGFIPTMLVSVQAYGLNGFRDAWRKQYLKLWFRWQYLKYGNAVGHADVCERIRGRSK